MCTRVLHALVLGTVSSLVRRDENSLSDGARIYGDHARCVYTVYTVNSSRRASERKFLHIGT